jgi:hypothetical protein
MPSLRLASLLCAALAKTISFAPEKAKRAK